MAASSTYSLPRCPVEGTLFAHQQPLGGAYFAELIYGTRRFRADSQRRRRRIDQGTHRTCEPWRRTDCSPARPLPKCSARRVHPTDLGQSLRPVLFSMVEWGSPVCAIARAPTLGALRYRRGAHRTPQRRRLRCLNEEGNEVARIVPTDAVWAVEINDPYRAHVDKRLSSPPR